MNRDQIIAAFLTAHGRDPACAVPLAQDASFRRYFRLTGGPRPAVLMDAPPPETVAPFLRVGAHLAAIGLSVPGILAADPAAGLLILEDFGDDVFAAITPLPAAHFDAAVDVLAAMQTAPPPSWLPAWGPADMAQAALTNLFEWWWPAMFAGAAPDAAKADITAGLERMLAPLAGDKTVFVHRDYFAGNLMWLPARARLHRVGVLDFQSAALGHPAYDLAALIQDARRDIPPDLAERATGRFLSARPELDPERFRAALAICAAQRHLRVACQFVRLARRDGRPGYLAHGPRCWRLLAAALDHPATAPLAEALDRWIPAERRANPPNPTVSAA